MRKSDPSTERKHHAWRLAYIVTISAAIAAVLTTGIAALFVSFNWMSPQVMDRLPYFGFALLLLTFGVLFIIRQMTHSDTPPKSIGRLRLTLYFTLIVFLTLLVTILIILAIAALLRNFGLLSNELMGRLPFLALVIISIVNSIVLVDLIGQLSLKPIGNIMYATDRIAEGDYSVRVEPQGMEEFRALGEKFNHMAQELGSVELLRTDFINNLSHEFKTPLVSMSGLARVLKREDLTREERERYLDLIISESERLSELANSVLALSKVEQQGIVTNKERFNVTEQLRLAVAMLDSKWADRDIAIDFDSDEIDVIGNVELLRQVWINLLDNAFKFCPARGTVRLAVSDLPERVEIAITNPCEPLSPDALDRIFEKFYQGDRSHAAKGNGLGLPIARKITELHGGTLRAEMHGETRITFTVELPK